MSENNNLQNNSSDNIVPYPLTPVVIEKKLGLDQVLNSQNDVINLVHEGNGIFSVEPQSQEQNNGNINKYKKNLVELENKPESVECKNNKAKRLKSAVEELEISTHKEDSVDLRHSESAGSVHERLSNETNSGKSYKVLIISSASSMRIFTNPKFTRTLIEESEFGAHMRGQIEVRGKGKSVKILIDSNANIDVSKIKKLGDYPIHAWFPLGQNQRVGVVSPVDVKIDIVTEFLPSLKLDSNTGNFCKIIDARRMRNIGKDLPCVRVVFECEVLPKKIIYNNTLLDVRPYLHNPLKCFKCQNYGHGANSCTNKRACPICLDNHHFEDCLQDDDPKCLHCNLDHYTGSKKCEFFVQASKIENKKRNGEISYGESKTYYNALNKCNLAQVRNDIARNILRGNMPYVDSNNSQSSSPMTHSSVRNIRDSPPLTFNNRFQPLETIDNDSDTVNDDLVENSSKHDYDSNLNVRKRVQKSRSFRKYRSYAHCLSTGDLVSEDPPNFDLFREKPKRNTNINLNRPNIEKNSSPSSNTPKNNLLADSFINDFKDSFLYRLLIKVRTFYNIPNKTGFQWVSFLIELFDFVGQHSEENQ